MAQHDYDIANQSGANFRTDLNNALDAIVSNNSGSSEPSTKFAYEWWIDTSNNLLKLRNSANNAWITLPLSITADNATSGALTVNGNLTTTGTVDINGQELILDADADTSITADTDDQIDFKIGNVDVATLTNSNLVLKGTTPTLTIGDAGAEDTKIVFDGNAQDYYIGLDDSADDLIIGKGSAVGTTPIMSFDENKDVSINEGKLSTSGASGADNQGVNITDTTHSKTHKIYGDNSLHIQADSGQQILFKPNATEAARFDASGQLIVGQTGSTSATKFTVNAGANHGQFIDNVGNSYAAITTKCDSNNNYFPLYMVTGTAGVKGYILTNSSGTEFNTSGSDERLKENIVDWNESVLDSFKSIKPKTFNFKDDENKTNVKGYIAQNEVDKFPEAYPINPRDDMHYFNPTGMTVYLMKAIQEQQTIIDDLKSRIETLEG